MHAAIPVPNVDNQEVDRRLKALGGIYQTTDSILAGEKVKVQIVQADVETPAWTDGATISLNANEVRSPDFDDILRLHGLNFHELAHVRYTPRKGTSLVTWVIDNNLMQPFNILEDQRIETLMTVRYPSTAPWLSAAILRWVISSPQSIPGAYAFVRGRRYLPGALRGRLRHVFALPHLLPEVDEVVDAYRRLVFPTDYEAAKGLIRRFQQILDELSVAMGSSDLPDPHGHDCHGGEVLVSGRPVGVSEQRDIRDKLPEDDQPTQPTQSQEEAESGEGEGEGEASETGEKAKSDGQASADNGTDDPPQGSDYSGGGCSVSGADDDDTTLDLAQDLLDDIADTDEVFNEVRSTQRQLRSRGGEITLSRCGSHPQDPDPAYRNLLVRLQNTLRRLQSQADPGWQREQSSGRINAARWAITQDVERSFDRWEEGVHDALDIEIVLLMDYSGSMYDVTSHVNNAMWVLKRAFDTVEISTTVIGFDHESYLLYSPNERADHQIRTPHLYGGTNPINGLEQAVRIMATTKRRHRIVLTITDGEWGWYRDEFLMTSDDYIQKLNEAGVLTAVGFIADLQWMTGSTDHDGDAHQVKSDLAQQHSHGARIAAPADGENLVPFVSSIVTDLIRKQLRGVS